MPSEQLNLEVVEIVRNWDDLAKRYQYERRLHELGPTAVETLLLMIREEVSSRRKRRLLGCLLLVLGFATISLKLALFGRNPGLGVDLLFFPIRYGFLFAGLHCIIRNSNRAPNILADFDDVRIVGPLLDSWNNVEARAAITDALIRLLPCMKASDAHLLNSEQRTALYRILRGKDETLLLAILKALEQIGDAAALPYVEKLANPSDIMAIGGKVSVAAQACLPFLTARAEQERNSMTLLRAAGTMEAQPDELLRPAMTASETDPHELLRANQQES